jgi:hypothetical protein
VCFSTSTMVLRTGTLSSVPESHVTEMG